MRDYSKISPKFWTGESGNKIREMGKDTQIVALYLLTCSHANMIGIYYLPIAYIIHDTGIEESHATLALKNLIKINFCSYDFCKKYVWVHRMARHQIAENLDLKDKRVKAINNSFYALPKLSFLSEFFKKYHKAFHLSVGKNPSSDSNLSAEQTNEILLEGSFLNTQDVLFTHQRNDPSMPLRSQEQEQEHKQKQEINISGKPDVPLSEIHFVEEKTQNITHGTKQDAITILEFLNIKTKRNFRSVDANIRLIMARLESGVTIDQCRQVIAKKTREWLSNEKMEEYLRPATLFHPTKFEQYLGELLSSDGETKSHED